MVPPSISVFTTTFKAVTYGVEIVKTYTYGKCRFMIECDNNTGFI